MPKIVDHNQRRKDIAAAACRAIACSGVERVTLTEIAEAAGYTTGMVTHYFSKKEDILRAALNVMLERADKRLDALMEDDTVDVIDVYLDVLPIDAARRREAAVWVSFWGLVVSDKAFARLNQAVHKEWMAIIERIVRARWPGADDWPADVFDSVRLSLLVLMNGLTAGAITSPRDYPASAQRDAVMGQFAMLDAKIMALSRQKVLEKRSAA